LVAALRVTGFGERVTLPVLPPVPV
jgi:hypothetical protein